MAYRSRSYFIKTLGCRVNQAESINIEKSLQQAGFSPVKAGKHPEVAIINSCVVTHKAAKETEQLARSFERKWPGSFLVVAGCAADLWQEQGSSNSLSPIPTVLTIPNNQKTEIGQIITQKIKPTTHCDTLMYRSRQIMPETGFSLSPKFSPYWGSGRALVKIQDGCDRFCAYCIVPLLRKRIACKPIDKVIKEVNWLVRQKGIKEVVFCGINLAKYRPDLYSLLKQVLKKTRIPRIRFGSIDLKAFDNRLIDLFRREYEKNGPQTRLCRHFHIPLQSGSNKILKLMRRPYTSEIFTLLVESLYQNIPGLTISTDLIIGFPGENKTDFRKSLKTIEDGRFINVHLFRFSPRQDTLAEKMIREGKWTPVDHKESKSRFEIARKLTKKIAREQAGKFAGQEFAVLFERINKTGLYLGRTDNNLQVEKKSKNNLKGKIILLKAERLRP